MAVKLGNGKWAVKENNLLAYNDNSGQFFNKEFDFTRGSSATYVGKDGLIKTAGLQDTNLVQNGDFSQLGSELITNLDFENGWGVLNATIDDFNSFTSTVSFGYIRLNNILTVGKTYILKIQGTTTSIGNVAFNIRRYGGSSYYKTGITGTFNETFTFTALDEGIFLSNEGLSTTVIDSISVKQVDPNDEWSLGTGWSYGDGVAYSDNTQTNYESLQQSSVTTIGKTYELKFNLNLDSGVIQAKGNAVYETYYPADNGEVVSYFVADSTFFRFTSFPNNTLGSITNISVQEIQVNTPRIDFSDSVDGALLLEPQSTNLLSYSEDFDNSYWAKGGSSVVSGFTSPDGSLNAFKLVEDTSTSTHYLQKAIGGADGNTYTFSLFAKKAERNHITIYCGGSFTDSSTFNLNNGTSVNNGNSTSKIEFISNGWYKCSVTSINRTKDNYIMPNNGDVGTSGILYQGDGTSGVYVWGAMFEQSSYATSYIPTQGSTSTRIAETCNNSGSAQDFNSEEGVLYAEISTLANYGGNRIIRISDGGGNTNAIEFRYAPDGNLHYDIWVGGVSQFSGYYTYFTATNVNAIAIKYKENDFALWINGTEVSTDTSGITFSANTLDDLSFSRGTQFFFYGKTKNIQVFTESLSDEELQKLTTI